MSSIFVTGASGQLGQCLQELAPSYTYLTRKDLDIANFSEVKDFFANKEKALVVNLAAYTQVDLAEEEIAMAERVNAAAVENLAQSVYGLISISTDYVFDGKQKKPYCETDVAHPLNMYGASKLAGENKAFAANPNTIIVRSSWLYSPFAKNFVKRMLELSEEKDELRIVSDQLGAPTSCFDLARVLVKILEKFETTPKGLYHFANLGQVSWFDLAKETLAYKSIPTPVQPIASSEFPVKAKRPSFSVLDTQKIQDTLGYEVRPWKLALHEVLDRL